jgi:hypothetical protein
MGSSGGFQFWTYSSSTWNTRMTISAAGNVGIGTTSPTGLLQLNGSIANSGDSATFTIKQSGTSYNNGIYIERSGERNGYFMYIGGGADALTFRRNYFGTQSDVMSLTRDGNVGIGTSSPGAQLVLAQTNANTTTVHYLTFRNLASGYGTWSISKANDNNLSFNYGTDSDTPSAGINMKMRYNGITEFTGYHGRVLINTSTDNGENLYVVGTIRATSTITANSDIRLKSNITKIENALEKVGQISGYTYNTDYDDKRHGGVIAQEMEKVFPEIVNTGNDGLMGVEYGNISALLIEAIKEQNTKIKNLETLLASK